MAKILTLVTIYAMVIVSKVNCIQNTYIKAIALDDGTGK